MLSGYAVLVGVSLVVGQSTATNTTTSFAPNYDRYSVLDQLVGTWHASAKSAGVNTEGRFECKWAPRRHCATWTLEMWEAGKPDVIVEHMTGVMGWNAKEDCLIEQVHSSGGIYLLTRWRIDGNTLIGRREGSDAQGREVKADNPVVLNIKNDEIRIDDLRYVTPSGDAVVEFTDIIWRRVSE
jgi:hypothetical protein